MIVSRTAAARIAVCIALIVALAGPASAGAQTGAQTDGQTDAEARRDDIAQQRSGVSSELDVLRATDAQIGAALDDIEAAIATQQDTVARAEAELAAAEADVRRAADDLRAARHDVAVLEQAIREMAVASYIHPPTIDLVHSLEAVSFSDALLQRAYLDARARRDVGLLELLEQAEANAARRSAELDAAADDAARAAEEAASALDALRVEEAEQMQFASRLQGRIDASLAEAAVLAELDAELAAQIRAEQAALIERLPPSTTGAVEQSAVRTPSPAPTGGGAPTPAPAPTRTEPAPSGPPTPPASGPRPTSPSPPSSSRPAPPLRTVQGITVHADIAADVDALLTAARADGISLSGWGYRSTDRQIELRMQHCGTTYYDIWQRPASLCSPPTAVPGRSLHERGRAIDFTHDGRTITSRSSAAFRWLDEHASAYGLYNLPSEPWHWSTSGG